MHPPEIDLAFSNNTQLRKRVHDAIDEYPAQSALFRDISSYILNFSGAQTSVVNGEPAGKKRKLENGHANGAAGKSTTGTWADAVTQTAWRGTDTSFSIPQRKKLTLEMVKKGNGVKEGGIRGINPATGEVEFGIAWKDVEQIFCLPLPEKAKRQHNFVVIPIHGDGVNPVPEGTATPDSIVWTFADATGKDIKEGVDPGPAPIAAVINDCLKSEGVNKRVVFPDEKEFGSAIVQAHRKGEKAFHVKGHRGSKEGFLFFTSVGIVWAFKKPIAYFSFDSINAVSYTSVLQRTFNLNIGVVADDESKPQEIEFSMLDQADYAGIDAYIKKHGLQDASMAEQRKAKRLNVNPAIKAENGAGEEEDGEDGETELQKAERLLQDQEDEEEEDYDPGNEGESDGSGSEEEDDEGEGYEEGVEYEEGGEGEGEEYEEEYDEGGEEMEGAEEGY
ncbi:Rtt106-domain-containing protein [Mytilinidion resinicola]|uniref:Rtt106-domain-containing protein n=1 Tax=Mytilinidion resinicola TaxID=574789 RepID=A0A6A6YLI0_9PEZI|nr:Rtt106-domain-containing protein [Mytilinidion resinicola]KAF2809388.1 Rtt106-domain-containing protein [Mytilinidion resinicola]